MLEPVRGGRLRSFFKEEYTALSTAWSRSRTSSTLSTRSPCHWEGGVCFTNHAVSGQSPTNHTHQVLARPASKESIINAIPTRCSCVMHTSRSHFMSAKCSHGMASKVHPVVSLRRAPAKTTHISLEFRQDVFSWVCRSPVALSADHCTVYH